MAHSFGFYGDGFSTQVFSDQSLWLRVLPGGSYIAQPILRGGRTCGISFSIFLKTPPVGSGLLVLCSLPTSCPNRTHVSGYYDAWPEWAVSVSVLPWTNPWRKSPRPRELSPEVMSTTNWRLPRAFAMYLCRDWILGCCSCWPEGNSGWKMRPLVIQEH